MQFGPAYPTISNWSIGASAMLCWAKGILYANCFKTWKQLLCSAFCYCGGMYCHPTSFISTEWFKDYWIGHHVSYRFAVQVHKPWQNLYTTGQLELLSFFMIELSLVEYEMLQFCPSMLAAAAIYTAQCTMLAWSFCDIDICFVVIIWVCLLLLWFLYYRRCVETFG